jgi:hypothetical protein
MRLGLFSAAIVLSVLPTLSASDGKISPVEAARRIADIEQRLEAIQTELRAIRRELAPSIMTPQQAYDSQRRDPGVAVTVEFGVMPVSGTQFLDVDLQQEPIVVTWDGALDDGNTFSVTLTPQVWRVLRLPGETKGAPPRQPLPEEARDAVRRHIETNGLRVTGALEADGHSMVVEDPAQVVLYLYQQPGTEVVFEPKVTAPRD